MIVVVAAHNSSCMRLKLNARKLTFHLGHRSHLQQTNQLSECAAATFTDILYCRSRGDQTVMHRQRVKLEAFNFYCVFLLQLSSICLLPKSEGLANCHPDTKSLSPLQLSSVILQWHRSPSHITQSSLHPAKLTLIFSWLHMWGWRAAWQPRSFSPQIQTDVSRVVFCLSIWIVSRFVTFFPPPPTPCLHSVTSLFFLPSQTSSSVPPAPVTRLLENPDSSDRSCAGPISWVLLTAGTHLITAETEVGGRACHSLSLDQCGPSTAVLGDGGGGGGGGGWYLSYSIASIRASADNHRLAFFVAVLRG